MSQADDSVEHELQRPGFRSRFAAIGTLAVEVRVRPSHQPETFKQSGFPCGGDGTPACPVVDSGSRWDRRDYGPPCPGVVLEYGGHGATRQSGAVGSANTPVPAHAVSFVVFPQQIKNR